MSEEKKSVPRGLPVFSVRRFRDIMNLCAAAVYVGYSQPYAGGLTGNVQDAYSHLTMAIDEAAQSLGVTEAQVWKWYRMIDATKPLTYRELLPIWDTVMAGLVEAHKK